MGQNSLGIVDYMSIAKDGINILFFLVVGVITILTYIKAKKTVLQPIKTEIFKIQLQNFSEIMELFNGKSEYEIREFFSIGNILNVNVISLLDNYVNICFGIEIERKDTIYNIQDCPQGIVTEEYLDKETISYGKFPEKNEVLNPVVQAAIWNNHKVGILYLTKDYIVAKKKIETIMKSPVLPKECVILLEELLNILDENVYLVIDILNEVVCEIPEKYPNIEDFEEYGIHWINNKYAEKIKSFEDVTNKLTDYLREYLLVDKLKEF